MLTAWFLTWMNQHVNKIHKSQWRNWLSDFYNSNLTTDSNSMGEIFNPWIESALFQKLLFCWILDLAQLIKLNPPSLSGLVWPHRWPNSSVTLACALAINRQRTGATCDVLCSSNKVTSQSRRNPYLTTRISTKVKGSIRIYGHARAVVTELKQMVDRILLTVLWHCYQRNRTIFPTCVETVECNGWGPGYRV